MMGRSASTIERGGDREKTGRKQRTCVSVETVGDFFFRDYRQWALPFVQLSCTKYSVDKTTGIQTV